MKTIYITKKQMNEIKNENDNYQLFNEINKLIAESLSINDNVVIERNKLCEIIKDKLDVTDEILFDKTLGLKYKQFNLRENCFSAKISINCRVFYCKDENYDDICNLYPYINDCYSRFINKKLSMLFFNFLLTEKKDISFYTKNIQHELNHIFQQTQMSSSYGSNIVRQHQYAFAGENIGSKDETINAISKIIYLSTPNEQDSFVNELYSEMENNVENAINNKKYKNSHTWKRLLDLQQSIDFFKENKESVSDKINHLNDLDKSLKLSYENLLKNGEIGFKRFKAKIGHVLVRVFDKNRMYETSGIKVESIYHIDEGFCFDYNELTKNKRIIL